MKVINKTDYDTKSLSKFFRAGLKAMGAELDKTITVYYSKASAATLYELHRGYALYPEYEIQGTKIWMGVPKEKLDTAELARTFEHEVCHTLGLRHGEMDPAIRYCNGPAPTWAEGLEITKDKEVFCNVPVPQPSNLCPQ